MDPWEIYLGLLAAPLLARLVWSVVTRLPRRTPAGDGRRLTIYELAYLAGGDNRVAETAIAALVERWLVRRGSRLRTIRRVVFLLYVAALAAGVVETVMLLVLGRPIGPVPVLVVIAAVACLIAQPVSRKDVPVRTTSRGRVALTREHRIQRQDAGLLRDAGAVAVGGLAMYPDEQLRSALATPSATYTAGTGGWFGTDIGGDGGGHGCGGGGCGGGGCGGGG